jgi:hypothetical protein
MKITSARAGFAAIALVLFIGAGCDWIKPLTTKEKMTGVWEVTDARDENGVSILNTINFPVTVIQLTGDNNVASTAGPMFMSIVYGTSDYVTVASRIDQLFDYNKLQLTNGEWACAEGYPDRFTIEMVLSFPGLTSFTDILSLLGVHAGYLDQIIYHKFMDVKVEFDAPSSDSVMTWEFDGMTTAVYNKKDSNLNYVLWGGWPTNSFGHYTFELTKRARTVTQLIQDH